MSASATPLALPVEHLLLALDQSPASVIITDTDATIVYVNERFVQVTGYTAREVLGRKPGLLRSGETSRTTYADLWSTIRAGGTWRGNLKNRRKSGELYWESVIISPIRNAA